jgi:protein O-GlcNAc transferase
MAASVEHTLNAAKAHAKRGEVDQARALLQQLIAKFPNNKRAQQALLDLDNVAVGGGMKPSVPQAEVDALFALYQRGDVQQTLTHGRMLAERYRESDAVQNALGLTHSRLAQLDNALDCYQRALRINPNFADAHYNLGNELNTLGRKDEAVISYERALKINPHDADALNNLGVVLAALGRSGEAAARYALALKIRPDYADAHINLGNALNAAGRKDEAVASYQRALALSPNDAKAHNNLGVALQDMGRKDEAVACYDRALNINPAYAEARAQRLSQLSEMCAWDAVSAEMPSIPTLGIVGDPVPPFGFFALEDAPARHRLRAEANARKHFQRLPLPPIAPPAVPRARLRIGYFSSDFRNHPVSFLAARMFELHDRAGFSVHAFSFGPDKDDETRVRLKKAFDSFHDVDAMSDQAVATLARREGIDIAVELNGYTKGTRLGVFAYGAAPVQMSYLGFPGTIGASFMHYMIADRIVIPPEHRAHYAEKLITLPGSYQANDNTRVISDRAWTRGELGLPESGFVFCCMNNTYKITPQEFDIWMRLLRQVDGSVLWASKANRWAVENLQKEAAKRGIDPTRIVFAQKVPEIGDHLARLRQADLFLDTFNFNAHTTASDALWAGLPVLTKIGDNFAARVAASLLTAVGLPELITHTAQAYEDMALTLARDPAKVLALTARLRAQQETAPLFDSQRFTRHMEDGYRQAYGRYVEGKAPDDISVKP